MGEITRDELSKELREDIVYNSDKIARPADVEIQGRTLVNLLGRSGNAIYKQGIAGTMVPVYDVDSFSFNNVQEEKYFGIPFTVIKGKNIILLYDYEGDPFNALFSPAAASQGYHTELKNDTYSCKGMSRFTTFAAFKDYDTRDLTQPVILLGTAYCGGNTLTTSFKIKNVRLYEITEDEYNEIDHLTREEIAKKYPYVDDVKCVVNPYIESKENLLDGASFTPNTMVNNGEVTTVDDPLSFTSGRLFKCEPNTTYTIYNPNKFSVHFLFEKTDTEWVKENELIEHEIIGERTVTTGNQNGFMIYFKTTAEISSKISNTTINITVVKGNKLKKYEDCHNSLIMFDTKLYEDETITRQNDGTYIKNGEWDEEIFNNLKYFSINSPDSNLKTVIFECPPSRYLKYRCVSYDGTILSCGDGSNVVGLDCNLDYSTNRLAIKLPNTLTGWGDNYTPTQEEVMAFFLGWKMYSVASGSYTIYEGSGTKYWAKLWCGIGSILGALGTVTGHTSSVCPTVINDQGYTPYRFIYKKLTPSVEEVKIHGSLVIKDDVDINVGSGLVLNESVIPISSSVGYEINPLGTSSTAYGSSRSNNRMEQLLDVVDENYKHLNYITRDLLSLDHIPYVINGGRTNGYVIDDLSTSYILYDYLIYSHDTVTSYEYTINTDNNVLDVINKVSVESVSTKNELDKTRSKLSITNKELERTKEELSQRSNPNLLINGDFQIWQRGTSFVSPKQGHFYTADRWKFIDKPNTLQADKIANGLRLTVLDNTTSNRFSQVLEIEDFKGATLTLSMKVKTNLSGAFLINPDYYDIYENRNNSTHVEINADKEFYSITMKDVRKLGLVGFISNNNIAKIGSYLDIEWVKLEIGNVPTPFIPRTYGEELELCRRYYQVYPRIRKRIDSYTGNILTTFLPIETRVRTTPTISLNGIIVRNATGVILADATYSVAGLATDRFCIDATKVGHGLTDGSLDLTSSLVTLDAEIY